MKYNLMAIAAIAVIVLGEKLWNMIKEHNEIKKR